MDKEKLEEILTILNTLTDEERHDIFGYYCRGCGSKNHWCTCQRDE